MTNRQLCKGDFLSRIEEIAASSVTGIILREKDLPETEYRALAEQVLEICRRHGVPCTLHTYVNAAISLGADRIHLPLPVLRRMTEEEKMSFRVTGASCHSPEDAVEAQRLGCSYITAGHIFATDCKRGLEPRGLEFLRRVCESVSIPVYAIGGINSSNFPAVCRAGAKGACVMSGLMRCGNVTEYIKEYIEGETHVILS